MTLQALRNHPFGHDLSRLLNEALNHDLRSESPELTDTHIEVIRHLSPTYVSKEFEYIKVGFMSLVPVDQVAEAAEMLIDGLKTLQMKPTQPPAQ